MHNLKVYSIHHEINQKILKKFSYDKISSTKNAPFFLLQAPTHQSFTLNLQFLYELSTRFDSIQVSIPFHFY